jgi:hypothetical protein
VKLFATKMMNKIIKYKTAVSKLANKLMTGDKIDTIATGLNTDRETIRNVLIPLT